MKSAEKNAGGRIEPGASRPIRWDLVALFLVISIGGSYLVLYMKPKLSAPEYTFDVVAEFDHDATAFTQGLILDGDTLWESTGQYGKSTIRETNLATGDVVNRKPLPEKYFGEGLTLVKDADGNERLIQLTWKSGKVFIYDTDLNLIDEKLYDGHGWGLAFDGTNLIVSDGTSTLRFLDPVTFEESRPAIRVRNRGQGVNQLNELEFVNGKVFANQWKTDYLYEIDPAGGTVEAVIDLRGLWPRSDRPSVDCVLNGIAFNPKTKHLLVTGKYCPKVWEIELSLKE